MVGGGNVKSNQRYSTARVRQVEMAALRRVVRELGITLVLLPGEHRADEWRLEAAMGAAWPPNLLALGWRLPC